MSRSIAVAVVLLCLALSAHAETSSTRCDEVEVSLDATRSVTRLIGCGEQYSRNLLWHLDRIDAIDGVLDGRANRSMDGTGAVVYVMDTGVLAAHQEFARGDRSNVVAGFDVANVKLGASPCRSPNKALAPCLGSYDELNAASHGTAVASIIAGKTTGVAPAARIVSIRVMNERGLATTSSYMDGLDAIVRHAWTDPTFRTAIVNISAWVLERLSVEPSERVVRFEDVEAKMRNMIGGVDEYGQPDPTGKRFLFVVAANNTDGGCGPDGLVDRFPAVLGASINGIITVGGMTDRNTPWTGGCRGGVEVLAPAQNILGASITAIDEYRGPRQRSGTSFAAPIVAGIAARYLSQRPDMTPEQLEAQIRSTPSRVTRPTRDLADGRAAVSQRMPTQFAMISGLHSR